MADQMALPPLGFRTFGWTGFVAVRASPLESPLEARAFDDDVKALSALAEAAARADSVMDALVRWRDEGGEGLEGLDSPDWLLAGADDRADPGAGREREPFRWRFEAYAPTRVDVRDDGAERVARFGVDASDDAPPAFARALVGVASCLLLAAAAWACARAVLATCDWARRAAFGEAEAAEERAGGAPAVDEVSLAAPLLVTYETEERAISHPRDGDDEDDGEQLLVLVPAEPEGRGAR